MKPKKLTLAMLLPTTLLVSLPGTLSATTYSLTPAADTFVQQSTPNSNYGSDLNLRIRNVATGQGQHSFLRFNIPALDGNILSATLRLRVAGAISEVGYYHVSMGSPSWSETSLTWNNWSSGTVFSFIGSRTNLAANTFLDLDVTNWITPSPVTFALASSADITGQRFYSEEEYGAYQPQLILQTDGAVPLECGPTGEDPGDPPDLLNELLCVMKTGVPSANVNYSAQLGPTFNQWANAGSENKPVIAAAVALFDGPIVNGTDYRTWWQDFLDRQASGSGAGNIWHFKGSELFSNVYDAATMTGVLAAHYWAQSHPADPAAAAIKTKAQDYLRRTWYAYALSASAVDFTSVYNVQGATTSLVQTNNRNCPVLAMASPRSKTDYNQDSKRWLFGTAAGFSTDCYKSPQVRDVVNYLAAQYSAVFGLTSTEKSQLQALVNNTTIPGSLSTVFGAARMRADFHFLLWSDGRRATFYTGPQLNNNIAVNGGKGTVYTAMYDPATRQLDLLFVLAQSTESCLDSGTRRVYVDDLSTPGCGSNHWITLPAANPTYHFVLGPTGWRTCSNLACI
ncbi:MAG TPA: DNRLRE domain-containing protein [Thermoanaerobaculia bacterium]|nr:DNRLRE domain-containing protein [Thermoanaerobaculia bacterium]